jgi:hypothetical protein
MSYINPGLFSFIFLIFSLNLFIAFSSHTIYSYHLKVFKLIFIIKNNKRSKIYYLSIYSEVLINNL